MNLYLPYLTVRNGRFSAFAGIGNGYLLSVSLPVALAFIRAATGKQSGAVPCWDCDREAWDSEFDLAPETGLTPGESVRW